jgi:hypothetical protein
LSQNRRMSRHFDDNGGGQRRTYTMARFADSACLSGFSNGSEQP